MSRPSLSLLRIAAAVFCVWYFAGGSCRKASPPTDAPDLVAAFATNDSAIEARTDALTLGELCRSIADVIEYDGQLEQPRLTTGVQLDRLRRWAREYRLGGKSLAVKYPELPPILRGYLDAKVGTSGGPITAAQRQQWVAAYRTIAAACEYAANL